MEEGKEQIDKSGAVTVSLGHWDLYGMLANHDLALRLTLTGFLLLFTIKTESFKGG